MLIPLVLKLVVSLQRIELKTLPLKTKCLLSHCFDNGAKIGNIIVNSAEQVIQGVGLLGKETAHLVVVSNNVFEDGICYDPATMEYIRAMGRINRALAQAADYVVEVVAGIPVVLKQGLNWKGQA